MRRAARGFTMTELMLVVAIIAVVMAIAVPSFTTISKDLELQKAKSDVYAALTAARSRALTSHNLVALHVFRDSFAAYANNPRRWGLVYNNDPSVTKKWSGTPHIPTGKMTLRLEVPFRSTVTGKVEFVWPADHDPILLPESLGICRPPNPVYLSLGSYNMFNQYVDVAGEYTPAAGAPIRIPLYEDFYIVFADDGKIATVLVDYDIDTPGSADVVNTQLVNSAGAKIKPDGSADAVAPPGTPGTYSAPGLCLYETASYKAASNRTAYVNSADCLVMMSPYTGLPLTEVSK